MDVFGNNNLKDSTVKDSGTIDEVVLINIFISGRKVQHSTLGPGTHVESPITDSCKEDGDTVLVKTSGSTICCAYQLDSGANIMDQILCKTRHHDKNNTRPGKAPTLGDISNRADSMLSQDPSTNHNWLVTPSMCTETDSNGVTALTPEAKKWLWVWGYCMH